MQEFSDSELLVLGLVAEMPRHGYDLEQVIDQRGMREWTQIGFSSIYYVLGKLESKRLLKAEKPAAAKARKRFKLTRAGQKVLVDQTIEALENFRPTYSSLLMAMLHWPVLTRAQALKGLKVRSAALAGELERIRNIHFEQQPLPDHVDAMFEFSITQLEAEANWITQTLAYMSSKPWGN